MSKPTVEALLRLIRTRLGKAINNLDANNPEEARHHLIIAIRNARYAFDITQEMTTMSQTGYTIPPREVVWDGREPGPRSGEYLDDFIARCANLKPGEDITEWATNQYRRLMK